MAETIKRLTKIAAVFKYPMGKPVMKALADGDALLLRREPTNQFDPNAVMVIGKNAAGEEVQLGYLPAQVSFELRNVNLLGAFKHHSNWDSILVEYAA